MASISFQDTIGAATLNNGMLGIANGVGTRFANWTPVQRPIGPAVTLLGTGQRVMFAFREDYGASMTIREIPNTSMDIMLRLQSFLQFGGRAVVVTGDSASRVYNNCYLAPGAEPSIELTDPTALTYTFTVSLINVDNTPMLCEY